jgi:hypothetical protein
MKPGKSKLPPRIVDVLPIHPSLPVPVFKTFSRHTPSFALPLFLLGIYWRTMAPGLTWANDGSDGGDLITAAFTAGVAHPGGYPLYLFFAHLFQSIPVGSLAWRTNLMSAVFAALSATLIFHIVLHTLNRQRLDHAWFAALLAGAVFGLAPLTWSQAVITEVYTLQACLTALILYLSLFPDPRVNALRAFSLGIAMGNHITTLFLLPLLFFVSPSPQQARFSHFASSLTRQLIWFAMGLSIYLSLPLRAQASPPINWGNPVTWDRFWWLVSGSLYRSYYLQPSWPIVSARLHAWATLMLQQFGWLGIVAGVAGAIVFFERGRLYFSTLWVYTVYSAFAMVYTSDDSYLYLLPACIAFSIWLGLAVARLLNMFHSQPLRWVCAVTLMVFFLLHALSHAGQVDASKDLRAERFGRQVMSEVPNDALIFARGDRAVFTLWYFHFALEQRPDVIVIAEELLHFDWYLETLHSTYPLLVIPAALPWPETIAAANPQRPVCYVQYTDQPEIECSGTL